MAPVVPPLHLGGLHPFETALTLVLAFGPFLLLGVVVVLRRRQDARQDRLAVTTEVPTEVATEVPVDTDHPGQRAR